MAPSPAAVAAGLRLADFCPSSRSCPVAPCGVTTPSPRVRASPSTSTKSPRYCRSASLAFRSLRSRFPRRPHRVRSEGSARALRPRIDVAPELNRTIFMLSRHSAIPRSRPDSARRPATPHAMRGRRAGSRPRIGIVLQRIHRVIRSAMKRQTPVFIAHSSRRAAMRAALAAGSPT